MKVLVTGCRGQLGQALVASRPADVALTALGRAELDVCDLSAVTTTLRGESQDLVINCAAYTAVDRAESEPALAAAVNAGGAMNLAIAARSAGARLMHLSTDFVFAGDTALPRPPDASTGPVNVYGRTKLDGERAVREALPDRSLILRTSWVYSPVAPNFVLSMLRIMRERREVRVVSDQIGTPTSAASIAAAIWALADRPELTGILHWTDSGIASWYDFAVAIAEEAMALGLLDVPARVVPIATADYPTPARRPAFSVLEKSASIEACGTVPPHWRVNLRRVLGDIARG